MNDYVINEETAEKEIVDFFNHFSLTDAEPSDILEELNIAKKAVQLGLLVFNEDKVPTFKFKIPVKNTDGEVTLDSVTFKTRILPNEHVKISKGLNIQKQVMEYALRCTAHLAGLPTAAYLDKLSKFDYTVLQQVGAVFA